MILFSRVGLLVTALTILFEPARLLSAEQWTIATFAGTGIQGFSGDGGQATLAQIDNPFGVIRGLDGAVWFCEYAGQRIRRIGTDGLISTIAGSGEKGFTGDGGVASQATFNLPHEIRFDSSGDLFIVDMLNHAIRKVHMKSKLVSTIAGNGKPGYSGDGELAVDAQLNQPHSIQFDSRGDLYICDIRNHAIRKIDMQTGIISTFAGTGNAGPTADDSPITGTPLNGPRSIDFDSHGDLWLATREGNQVFRLSLKEDRIYHEAGSGKKGFTGQSGPAKHAVLNGPKGIAIDSEGNPWLVDSESHTIWRLNRHSQTIELMAGTGEKGDGHDGDPKQCKLARPHGIFVDQAGRVFIGDSESHRIRVLTKSN